MNATDAWNYLLADYIRVKQTGIQHWLEKEKNTTLKDILRATTLKIIWTKRIRKNLSKTLASLEKKKKKR